MSIEKSWSYYKESWWLPLLLLALPIAATVLVEVQFPQEGPSGRIFVGMAFIALAAAGTLLSGIHKDQTNRKLLGLIHMVLGGLPLMATALGLAAGILFAVSLIVSY